MPVSIIIFFLSILSFILVGLEVRKYALTGKAISQPLLYVAAVVGSFGAMLGLLLWPIAFGGRAAVRPVAPLILSIVVTIVLALLPLFV